MITREELKEKYPKILKCPIAVGEGWFPLIDRLCSWLQFHTDKNDRPQIEAVQIKEKFGGLRFYVNGLYDQADGAISIIESLSNHTCEYCGSMENVGNTKGWIKTICEDCVEEHERYDKEQWQPKKK